MRSQWFKSGLVAVPVLAALCAGTAYGVAARSSQDPGFETNASGQTIGGLRVGGAVPELVPIDLGESPVELLAGVPQAGSGYIYSSDFTGPQTDPDSPDEAAKLMASRVDSAGDIWISVYAQDGKTVIGRLKVAHVEQSK